MQLNIVRNDITNINVDAIVLPANTRLTEGSGASNAIFEKAGRKELKAACKRIGKVSVGTAEPTLAYNLNTKFILHTVVPKWKDGNHQEYELLCSAYLSALTLADQIGCESVAFPLLAAGNNGFDIQLAFDIAKNSIESFTPTNKLDKVILVVYSRDVMAIIKRDGIAVAEEIDETYVLQKSEEYRLPIQRAYDESKEIAQKFLDDIAQSARAYLNDPENRKKILEKSVQIVTDAVKKRYQQ